VDRYGAFIVDLDADRDALLKPQRRLPYLSVRIRMFWTQTSFRAIGISELLAGDVSGLIDGSSATGHLLQQAIARSIPSR
jgi:hypothetical protein